MIDDTLVLLVLINHQKVNYNCLNLTTILFCQIIQYPFFYYTFTLLLLQRINTLQRSSVKNNYSKERIEAKVSIYIRVLIFTATFDFSAGKKFMFRKYQNTLSTKF